MFTLVYAMPNVWNNAKVLSSTTATQQQKNAAADAFRLEAGKIVRVFASSLALYYAYFTPNSASQWALFSFAVATDPGDVIATATTLYGIYKIQLGVQMHIENRKPIVQILKEARTIAKNEGYQFYNWFQRKWFGTFYPSETHQRVLEIIREIKDNYVKNWDQLNEAISKSWEHASQGLGLLGAASCSWIRYYNSI